MARRLSAGNLPAELTGFVGRRRELAEVRTLLSGNRLVTLTGPGGVGKTRLALRVADQARRAFPDGVWLVELAGLQDHLLVPQAVINVLGVSDLAPGDQVEVLAGFLRDRQLLLVMDNCEHLLPAVAELTVDLLVAATGVKILATSREALDVLGEHLYAVPPMAVPPADQPGRPRTHLEFPAVALFAERAAAADPGFVVTDANADDVATLCRRLDGMPLAIELTAARLRSLSLSQIGEQLDGWFWQVTGGARGTVARHHTLLAAVEWSFDLCGKPEQLLWMRAAVFAGGFELTAAERICGGNGLPHVLDTIAGLVGKSVLAAVDDAGGRRYRMLDVLARYGLDRLREGPVHHRCPEDWVPEPVLRRRHRDYYLELAEQFHADWFGPRQVSWSRRMRPELANLRAALGLCLDSPGEARVGLRLAGALWYLWYCCGQAREGRLWLERMLAADRRPSPDRAHALATYAHLLYVQGGGQDTADVAALARQSLELARRFGEPRYELEALAVLGMLYWRAGDAAAALPLLRDAVALGATADPPNPLVIDAGVLLASAALMDGDARRADEFITEGQRLCRAQGDQWYLSGVLSFAGMQALLASDLDRATAYGRESLRLRHELDNAYGILSGLELMALIAGSRGDHRRMARLRGAEDQIWRGMGGTRLEGPLTRRVEGRVADPRTVLGDAVFEAEFRRGGELTPDNAVAYALGTGSVLSGRREPADERRELTRREAEIAELVAQGLSDKQIADRLTISPRTVSSHVQHILAKLGFTSRTMIAAWLVQRRRSP